MTPFEFQSCHKQVSTHTHQLQLATVAHQPISAPAIFFWTISLRACPHLGKRSCIIDVVFHFHTPCQATCCKWRQRHRRRLTFHTSLAFEHITTRRQAKESTIWFLLQCTLDPQRCKVSASECFLMNCDCSRKCGDKSFYKFWFTI